MIQRFEELQSWQQARSLCRDVYRVTSKGPFAKDWGLRDQIRRAAVSVMSNLAEGFERGHRKEFLQFVMIAKGSCAEMRSQLYIAADAEYIHEKEFSDLMTEADRLGRLLGGLRRSLLRSPIKVE
jgi:four helix bundle protein